MHVGWGVQVHVGWGVQVHVGVGRNVPYLLFPQSPPFLFRTPLLSEVTNPGTKITPTKKNNPDRKQGSAGRRGLEEPCSVQVKVSNNAVSLLTAFDYS